MMNRNQIAMAATGGVAALVAAVFGALVWMESDTQEEMLDALESNRAKRARYAGSVKATEDAHRANAAALKAWADGAYGFAASLASARRDPSQEPAAFKQQMMEDARAISKLPEGAAAKIVKEDFGFGFNQYVNEGAMPARADLPKLQREWDDIVRIAHILVESGATELTGVSVEEKAPAQEERDPRARMRNAASKNPADAYPGSEETYLVSFLARPAALVAALNAFASDDRFFAVAGLRFEQPGDPLVAMLGGDKEKDREGGRRGRRRRGARAEEQEESPEAAEIARKGLVTDPAACAPFSVSMRITTVDFAAKEVE